MGACCTNCNDPRKPSPAPTLNCKLDRGACESSIATERQWGVDLASKASPASPHLRNSSADALIHTHLTRMLHLHANVVAGTTRPSTPTKTHIAVSAGATRQVVRLPDYNMLAQTQAPCTAIPAKNKATLTQHGATHAQQAPLARLNITYHECTQLNTMITTINL